MIWTLRTRVHGPSLIKWAVLHRTAKLLSLQLRDWGYHAWMSLERVVKNWGYDEDGEGNR